MQFKILHTFKDRLERPRKSAMPHVRASFLLFASLQGTKGDIYLVELGR